MRVRPEATKGFVLKFCPFSRIGIWGNTRTAK
jgi:hypothetical protein